MARKLVTTVTVLIEAVEIDDDAGAGSQQKVLKHRLAYEKTFESGTTDGTHMDRVWSSDADATTTPQDADLIGGLTSVLDSGNAASFADLCVVALCNDESSGGDDLVMGAGSNPLVGIGATGDIANVKPQGLLLWVAPYGVAPVAGTGDILRLVASAGTVPKRVLFAGRSA